MQNMNKGVLYAIIGAGVLAVIFVIVMVVRGGAGTPTTAGQVGEAPDYVKKIQAGEKPTEYGQSYAEGYQRQGGGGGGGGYRGGYGNSYGGGGGYGGAPR